MTTTTTVTATKIIAELKKAIKRFGEYSFEDKGPTEVMDVESIVEALKVTNTSVVKTILTEVFDGHKHGPRLVSELMMQLQDWDSGFDVLCEEPKLQAAYDGDY